MSRAVPLQQHTDTAQPVPLESRLATGLYWGLICILPLFFGGVHPATYLALFSIVFFFAGALTRDMSFSLSRGLSGRTADEALRVLFILTAYLFVFGIGKLFLSQPHPILGRVPLLYAPREYFNSWFAWTAGVAVTALTIELLSRRVLTVEFILRAVSFSGFLVSLVALSHWFYDNGKLFWIFKPEHVFVSERARWPFVSSNNLGHHLVLTLFPSLYLLIRGVRALFRTIDTLAARRPVRVLDLVNTPGVQMKIVRIVFDLFATLTISLALLASQSRGSWFGSFVGVLLYLWWDRKLHRLQESLHPNESSETLRERRRANRPLEGVTFFDTFIFLTRKLSFALGLCLAGFLLMMFLRDRGLDLVMNRAEYGLLASKDDIRWVMYRNTIPMIVSHPLFGVGLGAWNLVIGRYIDPALARLNPVYLHSDPLQFLAETGMVGAALVLFLAFFLVTRAGREILLGTGRDTQKILALSCSLVALVLGSLFDFPFRIPSLSFLFCILLGLLCHVIDRQRAENKT